VAIVAYGRQFETDSMLDIELWCFKSRLTVEKGGLGRTGHFIRICKEIWPSFDWHEWALEMAQALCEYDISGFTSGASSGKSEILAKFVLVSWFCDPSHTLCIVCSTTVVDARQKIWAHVVRNFREARAAKKSVGCIVESMNIIRLSEKTDGMAASDNASISLVAAGDAFKDDALKRLQGRHQKNVLLALDELQDCSQEIITTALGNLSANEHFEVHAAGNASSRFDAHGIFLAPVEGWNSINRFTKKWKIRAAGKEGMAYHFDGTAPESPNVKRAAAGLPQIAYLRTAEASAIAKITYGETSAVYLRQYVGFWTESEGESNFLVTEQSLTSHEAFDRPEWQSAPMELAGIDPSYSSEGDEFIFHHLRWGKATNGLWQLTSHEEIPIRATAAPGETKDHANIRECKRIAKERSISPSNIGMDNTGGNPLLSIAHMHWSSEILGVPFGGSPTELPISMFDKRLGKDVYANAVSELWGVFVEFLNSGQIRGIKPKMAKELTARKYELVAGGKLKVEKKTEMKKRLGYSPDRADSFMVALRVLRERLKIQAGSDQQQSASTNYGWRELARKRDVVTKSDPNRHHDQLLKMFGRGQKF
jgi:hypothetical protein